MTGFVGTREFDLNCFRPWTTIPANHLVIHSFLGPGEGKTALVHNEFVSRSLGIFLALASLGGIGVWDEPANRNDSVWQADYEAPKTEYGAGHRGVDLELAIGTEITAPTAGSLYFKGLVVDREVVTIRTTGGYLASFEPACTNLNLGDRVNQGEVIAWHCQRGKNYEYHCNSCVHFSARSDYGYISPDYLLGNLEPSVLED